MNAPFDLERLCNDAIRERDTYYTVNPTDAVRSMADQLTGYGYEPRVEGLGGNIVGAIVPTDYGELLVTLSEDTSDDSIRFDIGWNDDEEQVVSYPSVPEGDVPDLLAELVTKPQIH